MDIFQPNKTNVSHVQLLNCENVLLFFSWDNKPNVFGFMTDQTKNAIILFSYILGSKQFIKKIFDCQ